MANRCKKYLSIYAKPFKEVPQEAIVEIGGSQSILHYFVLHVKIQSRVLSHIIYKKEHYGVSDDNFINRKS